MYFCTNLLKQINFMKSMYKQVFISVFLFLGLFVQAQTDLSSPYHSIYNHLYNLQEDTYFPEKSALSVNSKGLDKEATVDAAIKLKQILDGKGIYINTNELSKNNDFTDSISNNNIYILTIAEPRIYLEKVGDKWLYSEETVAKIAEMYHEVYPFGTRLFINLLPQDLGDTKLLGLKAWQFLGLAIILLLSFAFYFLIKKLLSFIVHLLVNKNTLVKKEYENKLQKFVNAFTLVIIFILIAVLVPSLQFSPHVSSYIIKTINILLVFLGAIAVIRLVSYLLQYLRTFAERTSSKLDDQLLPIVQKLFNIFISLIAISIALKQLNVNLTAIIAGLSIGGLALALASQDTVKNFIGSVTIFIDHPFEIDDYIVIPGMEGTVEEVGMRATRIRTPGQSVAYVPNGELSNMIIDNLGLRIFRRWNLTIGVEYGTSSKDIAAFCEKAAVVINDFEYIAEHKTLVKLNSLGASSLDIFAMIFINVNTYNEELACKHEILLKLIDLAKEMNIEFAFPTQTLHIKK